MYRFVLNLAKLQIKFWIFIFFMLLKGVERKVVSYFPVPSLIYTSLKIYFFLSIFGGWLLTTKYEREKIEKFILNGKKTVEIRAKTVRRVKYETPPFPPTPFRFEYFLTPTVLIQYKALMPQRSR